MTGKSLREKATSGLIWSAFERFGQQGLVFVVQIVLARVLAPEQFGLIAMVTVFLILSGIVVDSGFSRALVQRKVVTDEEISTVFYFNLIISCLMTALLWLLAPLIAKFYNFSELTLILRLLSIRLIIAAFGSVQGSMLSRQLLFKKIFWVSLPSTLIAGIVAIILALYDFGVWALVWQNIIQALLMSISFWLSSKWRPILVFDIQCLKDMFPYGSRLAFSSFLDRGFQNIYVLVIGKYFSATELGYFQRAQSFQKLPVENVESIIGRVTFPLFSSIQDDLPRMRRGLTIALQLSTLLVLPGMALLAAISEPLILQLIGEKWLPSAPYLQSLCVVGALYPIHAINVNLLLAVGRSDLMFRIALIKKSLVALNILVTYQFGVQTMIYGMIVTSIIALGINAHYTKKLINFGLKKQVRAIGRIALLAFSIFGFVWWLEYLFIQPPWVILVAGGLSGVFMFFIGLRCMEEDLRSEIDRGIQRIFPKQFNG